MTTNLQRKAWAEEALTRFAEVTDGDCFAELPLLDQECLLSDLLADLYHYADHAGLDFMKAIREAIFQYDHEVQFSPGEDTPA